MRLLCNVLLDCCEEEVFFTLSSGGSSVVRLPRRTAPQELTESHCLVLGRVNRLGARRIHEILAVMFPKKLSVYS